MQQIVYSVFSEIVDPEGLLAPRFVECRKSPHWQHDWTPIGVERGF